MKLERTVFPVFALLVSILILLSCKKLQCREDNNSSIGGMKSHNFGQNCLNCHKQGGEGEGCFVVAGSVTDTSGLYIGKGQIEFYTQPFGGGELKYSVPIDGKGNFFSTNNMSIDGLYPAVKGNTQTHYMSSPISTGACNTCHGTSQSSIWSE